MLFSKWPFSSCEPPILHRHHPLTISLKAPYFWPDSPMLSADSQLWLQDSHDYCRPKATGRGHRELSEEWITKTMAGGSPERVEARCFFSGNKKNGEFWWEVHRMYSHKIWVHDMFIHWSTIRKSAKCRQKCTGWTQLGPIFNGRMKSAGLLGCPAGSDRFLIVRKLV